MKKTIITAILWIILSIPIVLATNYTPPQANAQWADPDTMNWFWDSHAVWWYQLPWTSNINQDNGGELIDIIKRVINRVLWLLSLVALILCLRWWFQMLTAAGDDGKVKTWTKILKNAAIWLVVIWLSWLLVSLIFRIIGKFAGPNWWS